MSSNLVDSKTNSGEQIVSGTQFSNGLSFSNVECLRCHNCRTILAGHRHVKNGDNPYCIMCYESIFANCCAECGLLIGVDCKDLSCKGKHWHELCFSCAKCRTNLVDKMFGCRDDRVYCGPCYGSECAGCGDVLSKEVKTKENWGRQWHEGCFICFDCKNDIGDKSFNVLCGHIYCTVCYEDALAEKCSGCSKAIHDEWITYHNQPWHRDCFTCTNCALSLAKLRFQTRDDLPYCVACMELLFSKVCVACHEAVSGATGTQFVNCDSRYWHLPCFSCSSCDTRLANTATTTMGFIEEMGDIICNECVRKRFNVKSA